MEEIKAMINRKPQANNRPPISKAEYMRRRAAREKLRRKRRMRLNPKFCVNTKTGAK